MDESKLKSVFLEILQLKEPVDWFGLKYRGVETWDSLAHMQLVAEIEDAFDIMIDTDDVIDMSSYDVTRQILSKYGITFE